MFIKRPLIICIVLALACAIIAGLSATQGPRIRRADIDAPSLAVAAGRNIILHTNQPLQTVNVSQVQITPATPFKVATTGDTIAFTFPERLHYNTSYRITVADLQGKIGPKRTVQFDFKVGDATLYAIKRQGVGKADLIVATNPATGTERTVYQHQDIKEFAKLGNKLVVVANENETSDQLLSVDLTTSKDELLNPPDQGKIDQLHASPKGKIFGYRLTGNGYQSDLIIHTLADDSTTSPKGPDDKVLPVQEWGFSPDGVAVMAHTYEDVCYIIDSGGTSKAIPLGAFQSLLSFSPSGKKIAAIDHEKPITIDVKDHSRTPLAPPAVDGKLGLLGAFTFLGKDDRYAEQVHVWSDDATSTQDSIIMHDGQAQKTLFTMPRNNAVLSMDASPNGQFVALQIENNKQKEVQLINTLDGTKKTLYGEAPIIE